MSEFLELPIVLTLVLELILLFLGIITQARVPASDDPGTPAGPHRRTGQASGRQEAG